MVQVGFELRPCLSQSWLSNHLTMLQTFIDSEQKYHLYCFFTSFFIAIFCLYEKKLSIYFFLLLYHLE